MVQGARITRPHRMHGVQRKMRPIVTDVSWSVCVSVCVCLSAGHDRESHKNGLTDRDAVFGLWTPIGPTNHVLCGSRIPRGRGILGAPVMQPFVKILCPLVKPSISTHANFVTASLSTFNTLISV